MIEAAPDDAVVVIEDCHHLTDPAVVRAFREIVDGLPDHLTLVVTSRSDPPLRRARLRAAGRLTEIRAGDLAFDHDQRRRSPLGPVQLQVIH